MSAPRWATALLRFLAPTGRAEDVLGDLEEAHWHRIASHDRLRANLLTAFETFDMAFALLRLRLRPTRLVSDAPSGGIFSWLDVKLGLRMLAKYPALSIVGGLGIAVAIAVSVGFFAFMSTHFFTSLPLDEGDRIVALENRDIEVNNEERRALHDFVLWRQELRTITDIGAFRSVTRNLRLGEETPQPVRVAEMTAAGFSVARIPPLRGRHLVEHDERSGAPPVLVIGHDAWRTRFAGDSSVIGRAVRLGATMHTVVGVMPDGFGFPESHQYWVPLRADPAAFERRGGPAIFIFGRLAPGVTMEEAQAELEAIGRRSAMEFPESNGTLRPMVMPYIHSLTDIQGMTAWNVIQMQLMVGILLVVVALNVAVLVYARTATRQGEIAVRTAMGASRGRVVAQLFVEALVLSLIAAAVGLGLAHVGVSIGNQIMETEMSRPFWADYSLRPSTVVFTIGIAVVAAVIVGVVPALQATGRKLQSNLRQLGGGTGLQLGTTWTVLIVAQVAIAVAALPAAVNMGWSEIRTATTQVAYDAEEYLVATLQTEAAADAEDGAPSGSTSRFGIALTSVLERLEADPRVAGVTFAAPLPGRSGRVEVEGASSAPDAPAGHVVSSRGVAPGYLELFGATVLTGRGFDAADADSASRAVVVSRAFAQQVVKDGTVLGRRVRFVVPPDPEGEDREAAMPRPGPWFEIVGIVEDLQVNKVDPTLIRPALYYAISPEQVAYASIDVRVRGSDAAAFAPAFREIVASVDPTLRLGEIRSRADLNRQGVLALRLMSLSIGLVLVSVFLLSAAGVYALTSLTVTRRRREIGIRAALGANPGQVLRSIFGRVARQVALGVVVGVTLAAVLDITSDGALMGGRGSVLLPVFAALMIIVALLAAFGPARRGLRIAPTEALRSDA